jgi:hypothetical protein
VLLRQHLRSAAAQSACERQQHCQQQQQAVLCCAGARPVLLCRLAPGRGTLGSGSPPASTHASTRARAAASAHLQPPHERLALCHVVCARPVVQQVVQQVRLLEH